MLCLSNRTVEEQPTFFQSMIKLLYSVDYLKHLKYFPSYSDKGFVMITAVISVCNWRENNPANTHFHCVAYTFTCAEVTFITAGVPALPLP